MTHIAFRSERVGIGSHTFDLVAGEPVPDVPAEVLKTLVENQQVYDDGAPAEPDIYSQEYRDRNKAAPAEPAQEPEAPGV